MSEQTSIGWTQATFNPVRGCTMVSPGCAHCYAAREAKRFPNIRGIWGDAGTRVLAVPDAWKEPLRWDRKAKEAGTRKMVFCASLADVFEDWKGKLQFPAQFAPDGWLCAWWDGQQMVREYTETAMLKGWRLARMDDMRTELFQLIEKTPNLIWQLLTKRPQNVMRMVPSHWLDGFPENVWMGTTVENQDWAEVRVPILLEIPAKVRFLSCEPLIGPVNLDRWLDIFQTYPIRHTPEGPGSFVRNGPIEWKPSPPSPFGDTPIGIHQIIVGGESGPDARPMHPDWARTLRDQCAAAGVSYFMKQWGEWAPGSNFPDHIPSGELCNFGDDSMDESAAVWHVGKKAAGRLLDGVLHDGFPAVKGGAL